jgi:predicted amidohydrolase
VRFTGPDGSFLGFHAKILRCGTLEEPARGEIEHYAEAALQTFTLIGVTVGALICNDLWANPGCTPMPDPHLTQQLSRRGARVVLHAVNGGRNGSEWSEVNWRFHESNLRMRARASDLWIVTVDNCWPESSDCSAPSGVVGPDGSWRYRSPERGEDVFVYDIELGDEGSG